MKGFKKLALVAAIAAPFSSVHALEAIDDAMLSDMTGQAGVTIDLETSVSIGQVQWNDTDTAGVVNLNTIALGGWAPQGADEAADKLDNVRLVIDSNNNGDLEILVVTQTGFNADGTVNPQGEQRAVDLGLRVGSVELAETTNNTSSTIMSNINLNVLLGPQKFVVQNNDANGLISAKGFFQLHESSSLKVDVAGVTVDSLKVGNFAGANVGGIAGVDAFTGTDYTAAGFAYYDVGISTNASDQLVMDVNNFNADIQMGVSIGGASIGQITMTDFDVSGTQLTVYGH
jgi:hypothetical protein